MAYTDRYYATSEDDPFPTDPFRKYFGKPSPTPTPKPRPVQLAMAGSPTGVLRTKRSAASLVNPGFPTEQASLPSTFGRYNNTVRNAIGAGRIVTGTSPATKESTVDKILPNGAVGLAGGTGEVAPQMTHTEFALDVARRNQSALEPQAEATNEDVAQGQSGAYQDFQSPEFYNKRGDYTGPNLAARGDLLRAATAYRPTLDTATLPGKGALDIVPVGTPLMSVKGIVNPFTGQTSYQPVNQPSPYQGPGTYQIQQAATDFYRKREEDRTGYGSAY